MRIDGRAMVALLLASLLLVGVACGKDDSANEAGAAYLFVRTGTTWEQQAYIKGSNTEAYDEFGSSLALDRSGRTLVISARGEDGGGRGEGGKQSDNSVDEAGAVYLFHVTR